jgi:hypothetical protein
MGRAHVVLADKLLDRLRNDEGEIARRVTVVHARPFSVDTSIALIATPLLPEGYNGVQDIIIEDGTGVIRLKKDADV